MAIVPQESGRAAVIVRKQAGAMIARAMDDQPKQVQRIGIVRISAQDPLIERARLLEVTCAVRGYGVFQQAVVGSHQE